MHYQKVKGQIVSGEILSEYERIAGIYCEKKSLQITQFCSQEKLLITDYCIHNS